MATGKQVAEFSAKFNTITLLGQRVSAELD